MKISLIQDTWVRGKKCSSSDGSCDGKGGVDAGDQSVRDLGKTWSVTYGSGKASGDVFSGPVSIGGAVANIPFGIANNLRGFNISLFDGLMGLGYDSISQISQAVGTSANYFDGLHYTGEANRFAFYFSNYNNGNNDNGEVTFGGVNSARYTGAFNYIPLNSKTYWQFSMNGGSYGTGSSTYV